MSTSPSHNQTQTCTQYQPHLDTGAHYHHHHRLRRRPRPRHKMTVGQPYKGCHSPLRSETKWVWTTQQTRLVGKADIGALRQQRVHHGDTTQSAHLVSQADVSTPSQQHVHYGGMPPVSRVVERSLTILHHRVMKTTLARNQDGGHFKALCEAYTGDDSVCLPFVRLATRQGPPS